MTRFSLNRKLSIQKLQSAITIMDDGHPAYLYKLLQKVNVPYTKNNQNCTPAAINEFPPDGFTKEQRKSGWIALHVFFTIYSFIILSTVCDAYFVPAIQLIVKRLKLSEDVVGASFMAITNSSPELFINFVGTFVTEGDIGVGTVVGSNVFNILAVPVCCGFFAKTGFHFDWWLIIRDGLIYGLSVVLLIITLSDDRVYWYEALTFVSVYSIYIFVLYFNNEIRDRISRCCCCSSEEVEANHELNKLNDKPLQDNHVEKIKTNTELEKVHEILLQGDHMDNNISKVTIVEEEMTKINNELRDTVSIPDSVMGLIFLAIGSSIPEIVSCIIVSRQGQGVMGMSSALGANNFEVLLCLGLPWLIKTLFYPKANGAHWITINSSGLAYNAACLLSTLILLYITIICNKFKLNWRTGLICLIMYCSFLIIGTLIELNVFFMVNLPTCT
ncbi:hypothetical protein FQA39_LY01270 [Lamprigera yunnana]|nr:hypothetical protein FQA39_LY01270 [Lamprigera yunnana]